MNINETSSYKKAKRLLFKQNCLKRSLFYVELQVGFEPPPPDLKSGMLPITPWSCFFNLSPHYCPVKVD